MIIPNTAKQPRTRNAVCRPATNALGSLATASRLGSDPMPAMVAAMMAVETPMLVMLAELLVRGPNAETAPYLDRSTPLSVKLLFGVLNKPLPQLWNIMINMGKITGESDRRVVASRNKAVEVNANPATENVRDP